MYFESKILICVAEDAPMSRTHQYRHMVKPLLERKRRARINKCLDELKVGEYFAQKQERNIFEGQKLALK